VKTGEKLCNLVCAAQCPDGVAFQAILLKKKEKCPHSLQLLRCGRPG
jgi:hypothetical protein